MKVPAAFKKDKKRCHKRGYDFAKLQSVIDLLQSGQSLPENMRPHKLAGAYEGKSECHVEPDWLLIYRLDNQHVYWARMGTHSDLF